MICKPTWMKGWWAQVLGLRMWTLSHWLVPFRFRKWIIPTMSVLLPAALWMRYTVLQSCVTQEYVGWRLKARKVPANLVLSLSTVNCVNYWLITNVQKIEERFTRKVRSGGIRFLDRVPVLKVVMWSRFKVQVSKCRTVEDSLSAKPATTRN